MLLLLVLGVLRAATVGLRVSGATPGRLQRIFCIQLTQPDYKTPQWAHVVALGVLTAALRASEGDAWASGSRSAVVMVWSLRFVGVLRFRVLSFRNLRLLDSGFRHTTRHSAIYSREERL